jgi:hypothetical protein
LSACFFPTCPSLHFCIDIRPGPRHGTKSLFRSW